MEQCCVNTDKEIWREHPGDYYSDSIHVTEGGGVGINCGGHVIVSPVVRWHEAGKLFFNINEIPKWKKKLVMWLLKNKIIVKYNDTINKTNCCK